MRLVTTALTGMLIVAPALLAAVLVSGYLTPASP
jgi:hypothetical protein